MKQSLLETEPYMYLRALSFLFSIFCKANYLWGYAILVVKIITVPHLAAYNILSELKKGLTGPISENSRNFNNYL